MKSWLDINWNARFKHKCWWISIISLIIVLLQQVGLYQLTDYIPKNYADILNTIFVLLPFLGVSVDTSTTGIADQVIQDATVQATNQNEEVKTESTTTSINNTVSENSKDAVVLNSTILPKQNTAD